MVEIFVHHTHLYPGAKGRLAEPPADGPALVEFSDGVAVTGRMEGETLAMPAYRTAAGTKVDAKRWRLAFNADGFKVRSRLVD